MSYQTKTFWTCLIVYLTGKLLFGRGDLGTIVDLLGLFTIVLGLFLLGRWVWGKLHS